ncbi:hypothetical protein KFZ76_11505 [Methylovulum psychrotolerans]|uniref:hypothetical protein n=1 Tax=Methylovulum psychrotolerans TaxID=1704499 RepID=UPI001BFF8A3D|nr:hypothetical protein [Methylovulum psychrotolerans]MBT9098331.1 hypothetical protein [Methylovulum psychrotolerans]
MDQEIYWLSCRIEDLSAAIRQMRWYFAEVQELRKSLAPIWNDSCALEMAKRFLNPMALEAEASLTELERQVVGLLDCVAALSAADNALSEAVGVAEQIDNLSGEVQSMFRVLDGLLSDVVKEADQALAHISNAETLIAAANSAA